MDLKEKPLWVPVYQLLRGKVRSAVRRYASALFANATEPGQFAEKVVQALKMGYKALKWDPFGTMFATDLSKSLELVEAV